MKRSVGLCMCFLGKAGHVGRRRRQSLLLLLLSARSRAPSCEALRAAGGCRWVQTLDAAAKPSAALCPAPPARFCPSSELFARTRWSGLLPGSSLPVGTSLSVELPCTGSGALPASPAEMLCLAAAGS